MYFTEMGFDMRIAKHLFTLFYILYALLFSGVFLWGIGSGGKQGFLYVLVMGIGSVILLLILQRKISDLSEEGLTKLLRVSKPAGVIFLLLQIIFTAAFQTTNNWGWDFDTVNYLARSFLNGVDGVSYIYLAQYRVNLFYFWIIVLLLGVTKIFSGNILVWNFFPLLFNILVLDVSLFGVYKLVELLQGKRLAYFSLLSCLLFTPYWLYLPIAYTDTFSVPFFVFPILFTIYYEKKKTNSLLLLGSGVLGGVGYHLKGIVPIVVIAILIYIILRGKSAGYGKRAVLSLLGGFLGAFFLTGWLLDVGLHVLVPENVDTYKNPIEYGIYTGLVGDGSWNAEIVAETSSYTTYEGKQTYLREAIAKQLKEYGVLGLAEHMLNKEARVIWNKGTLTAEVYVRRLPKHDKFVECMIGEDSIIGKLYRYYSQGYWRAALLFFIIGLLRRICARNREESWGLLLITTFGLFLFFSFWESAPRHILSSAWIILVVEAENLYALGEQWKAKKLRNCN